MYKIVIPPPQVNTDPVTGEVIMRKTKDGKGEEPDAFSFAWWLHHIVFQHPTWKKEAAAIRAMVRIDKAHRRADTIAGGQSAGDMLVESADLVMLKECAEHPQLMVDGQHQAGYPVARLAQLCLPHIDAVANAIEEK